MRSRVTSLVRHALLWTVICSASAAPSFLLALTRYGDRSQVAAMLAGVACFIVAFTLVSAADWARRFRAKPFVLATLRIGYGTRLLLSGACLVIPPLILADAYLGSLSIVIVREGLGALDETPLMVFLTTVLEGLLWNVILATFMVFVHGVQIVVRSKPSINANVCRGCGYDLRASPKSCPECGRLNTSATRRA